MTVNESVKLPEYVFIALSMYLHSLYYLDWLFRRKLADLWHWMTNFHQCVRVGKVALGKVWWQRISSTSKRPGQHQHHFECVLIHCQCPVSQTMEVSSKLRTSTIVPNQKLSLKLWIMRRVLIGQYVRFWVSQRWLAFVKLCTDLDAWSITG